MGPMRCHKCAKIVGFAEAVHRDEKVFHRDCYRCNNCNKVLQRGQGLTHQGENYCHHCHAKNFGPMGFKPGVLVKKDAMKRVTMKMQPPFAHVSVDLRNDKKAMAELAKSLKAVSAASKKGEEKAKPKLHAFEVAVFQGTTVEELQKYLADGKVDTSSWAKGAMKLLLDQLVHGKSELGLDPDGNALRVVSVVKAMVYDDEKDLVLFNPLNSFEEARSRTSIKFEQAKIKEALHFDMALGDLNVNVYPGVLDLCEFRMDHVPRPIHDFVYPGVYEDLGFKNISASGNKTIRLSKKGKTQAEIPASLVLETTFATLNETPAQAASRIFAGRFSMKHATPKMFSKVIHKQTKTHDSTRFPGLNTQYHIHYMLLKKQLVTPLQKTVPNDRITPISISSEKAEVSRSGMNTNWYVWLRRKQTDFNSVIKELQAIYMADPRVKTLVGDVDFNGDLAAAMGTVLMEEIKALDLWGR